MGEHTYDLSYSGLKTNVINLVHNLEQKGEKVNVPNMCRSFQDVAIGMVVSRVRHAIEEFGVKEVVLGGGVSANSYLRSEMKKVQDEMGVNVIIPPIWCTTDNAAMIAKVAEKLYQRQLFAPLDISVDPNWRIEDYEKF